MRYVELFAGAGGLSMGLEAAGMHPVAHAEIEPHARAVLRHHWPDTPLHGDVTQVDWTRYAGQVDLVAGGSPCQDLSVAGKRAGLAGARSGLFYELIRAWEETGAPYCLWENVDGARSSNGGKDFAAVLSTFVGAAVAVPSDGWRSSGVAAGRTGVAAWRVLDLQHFGPPQRRRRIFVVAARTGGADPAEILALAEGVCGHPSPRDQSRQGAARGAAGGAAFSVNNDSRAECVTEGVAPLRSGQRQQQSILAFDTTQITSPANYSHPKPGDPCHPLAAGAHPPAVLAFHHTQNPIAGDISPSFGGTTNGMAVLALDGTDTVGSLLARADSSPCVDRGQPAVLAFPIDTRNATRTTDKSEQNRQGAGIGDAGDPSPTLTSLFVPAVLAFEPRYWLRENKTGGAPSDLVKVDASIGKNGDATPHIVSFQQSSCTGRGTMGVDENTTVLRPVRTQRDHQMICLASGQANAEVVRDGVPTLNTIHEQPIVTGAASAGRPRRLTPLECERLMGWPDRHTAQGVKEDGTVYALSDTARYRLCGNGVGTPVAAWIATRLVAAVEALCPP